MEPATPILDAEFVAFDLETTGLHPASCQIVELGAVRFRGDGELLGQFEQLIDPQCPIPRIASQIHGITNRMVAGQPTLAEAIPRFLEFLSDDPVLMLAHNASFDLRFLSAALSRLGHPCPMHQTLDTCRLARRRIALPRHSLEALGRHLGLIEAARHRALDDALLLKEVFLHLLAKPTAVRRVEELYQLSPPRGMDSFMPVSEQVPQGYEELWQAMAAGLSVDLRYAGGHRPGQLRRVTPRRVMQMRGSIYLSAFCHQGRCEKTFRLDRIQTYHVLPSNKVS